PGTRRLFSERFATPDGRARFVRVEHRDPAELPDRDYPYVLTTGRLMQHYQSGTQTRRVRALMADRPDPVVELHPDLARRHGVAGHDLVELRTRRGRALFRARVTDAIRPDTLFAPFHWGGEASANALTNPALDPASRMPAFKVCAVALRRVQGVPPSSAGSPVDAGGVRPPSGPAAEPLAAEPPAADARPVPDPEGSP
ncbi:MAG TPA: molybdopterin oxidoreductase family protein, partial [Mycobacteriales bacterium]|nr:molybdopterin oxidoreductase family protein [Mycobacteriales bacterium]